MMDSATIATQCKEIEELKKQLAEKSQPFEDAVRLFMNEYRAHVVKVCAAFASFKDSEDEEFGIHRTLMRKLRDDLFTNVYEGDDVTYELKQANDNSVTFNAKSTYGYAKTQEVDFAWLQGETMYTEIDTIIRDRVMEFVRFHRGKTKYFIDLAQREIDAWENKNSARVLKKKKPPKEVKDSMGRARMMNAINVCCDKLVQFVEKNYADAEPE